MSTGTWNDGWESSYVQEQSATIARTFRTALVWMGSLKITVTMFALGMFLLLVGTLAQDDQSIPEVKRLYFNSFIAVVPLDVFLPTTLYPHSEPIPGAIPFPGGALVGFILLVNLIAAKLTRFSMQAKGAKLAWGLLLTAIGFVLIGMIIFSAHRGDGIQGEPPIDYGTLWLISKWSVIGMAGLSLAWATLWRPQTTLMRWVAWITASILSGLAIYLLISQTRIGDPGLRIVWQLGRSFLVSLTLLAGLVLLFGKRGGNVLIHLAIALLMLGQFLFGDKQIEERITLKEGQSTNESYRLDEIELAVIDARDATKDKVVAISASALERSKADGKWIVHPDLPFDILCREWMRNSNIKRATEGGSNLADEGSGKDWIATLAKTEGGTSNKTNIASAYVTLREKETTKELGTYLVSQWLNETQLMPRAKPETFLLAQGKFDMELRFRRSYKPYSLTLDDVRRINYSGSPKPRDFSSFVTVIDQESGQQQTNRIWMNNPMRYQGETFYQSGYSSAEESGVEVSTLQVVTNAGWLIPYVCCVLVGLGMLAHFGNTFVRFAARYDRSQLKTKNTNRFGEPWIPIMIGLAILALVAYRVRLPSPDSQGLDWSLVATIPMEHEGRLKPFDTVARNLVQAISNKTSAYIPDANPKDPKDPYRKISATQWLMGVIADAPWVDTALVFRVDEKSLLDRFQLERTRRKLYSYEQIRKFMPEVREELRKLQDIDMAQWSFEQRKLAEINTKFGLFESVLYSYRPLLPRMPADDSDESRGRFQRELMEIFRQMQVLESTNPPGILPPPDEAKLLDSEDDVANRRWRAYGPAFFRAFVSNQLELPFDREPLAKISDVIDHYRSGDAKKFNKAVIDYLNLLQPKSVSEERAKKLSYEAWFNHFDPVNTAMYLYVLVGVLGFAQFLIWKSSLQRAAFWLCLSTFAIHTFAVAFRIYLSERPPVVSLYSSAVFIGWGAVLFALVLEAIYPLGLATLVGSIAGFVTLIVAWGLSAGDTMPVLEAVLDTQFWLTTHVTTVALGYTATFVAGTIAIILLVELARAQLAAASAASLVKSSKLSSEEAARKSTSASKSTSVQQSDSTDRHALLYRMCYAVVCFALFFSFVGTVLGGLWADDSWGRFWGWDPKENGALMIVLWNALLLHARWDRLVAERGFALLAMIGNIVTAWSWFGTNQLQIGLHSYGFTSSAWYSFVGFVFANLIAMGFLAYFTMVHTKIAPSSPLASS